MRESIVAIDIGGTKMLIGYEIDGVIKSEKFSTGVGVSFKDILATYKKFLRRNEISPIALVVAIPGLVTDSIVNECDVVPSLVGVKASDFSVSYSVEFINDVESALLEERSNYKDVNNLIVIMIGTGIGMSMIIDGKKSLGASGFSGELGYTVVNTESGVEYLDNVSAGAGLLKKFGNDPERFINALNREDDFATEILNRGAKYMGLQLSSVISLLNPELIVIGGGTSTYKGYFEHLVETVDKVTLHILREATKIVRSSNPGLCVLYGALIRARVNR